MSLKLEDIIALVLYVAYGLYLIYLEDKIHKQQVRHRMMYELKLKQSYEERFRSLMSIQGMQHLKEMTQKYKDGHSLKEYEKQSLAWGLLTRYKLHKDNMDIYEASSFAGKRMAELITVEKYQMDMLINLLVRSV